MDIKAEICRQITGIENNGFAYLGPVLREALFSDSSKIDWEKVSEVFLKYNPEKSLGEPTIDSYGVKRWRYNGKLHREDGPAVEYPDGYKSWYKNGFFHRVDGPAVEDSDGTKMWYQDGKLHREDGPAIECANGDKYWYKNGERHREDGPAIEYANGEKYWYLEGKIIGPEAYHNK